MSSVIKFPTKELDVDCDICGKGDGSSISQTMKLANPSQFNGRQYVFICLHCALEQVQELIDVSMALHREALEHGFLKNDHE